MDSYRSPLIHYIFSSFKIMFQTKMLSFRICFNLSQWMELGFPGKAWGKHDHDLPNNQYPSLQESGVIWPCPCFHLVFVVEEDCLPPGSHSLQNKENLWNTCSSDKGHAKPISSQCLRLVLCQWTPISGQKPQHLVFPWTPILGQKPWHLVR